MKKYINLTVFKNVIPYVLVLLFCILKRGLHFVFQNLKEWILFVIWLEK